MTHHSYPVHFHGRAARAANDLRWPGSQPGVVRDRVVAKASPTAPEVPVPHARVLLLRLRDGFKAWDGYSNAQGRYEAIGLEAGVEYVAVGIDNTRHYKVTGAGPVTALPLYR